MGVPDALSFPAGGLALPHVPKAQGRLKLWSRTSQPGVRDRKRITVHVSSAVKGGP